MHVYFAYAIIIVSWYVAYVEFAAATSRICKGALAVNGPLQPEVTATRLDLIKEVCIYSIWRFSLFCVHTLVGRSNAVYRSHSIYCMECQLWERGKHDK